jgi:hypothetical protein
MKIHHQKKKSFTFFIWLWRFDVCHLDFSFSFLQRYVVCSEYEDNRAWRSNAKAVYMIFKFKMTSTKNMFSILGSYGPELSPHIVFLLKTSGYVSFWALSKITAEKILDIEKFIRTLFSGKTLTEELSKEDRISQFGPLYRNKPEIFHVHTRGQWFHTRGRSKKLIEGETLPTLKLPRAAIFQTKKSTYRNPPSNPATLAQKTR